MIIQFNQKFSINNLRRLSRVYNLRYISKLCKNSLLNLINYHKAATFIQRSVRNDLMKNKICPISHEELIYPFISIKINDHFFYYDFKHLVKYFNKVDEFIDPCTRQPIPEKKIHEINRLIRYYYRNNSNNILVSKTMIKKTELNIIIVCLRDLFKELENNDCCNIDCVYNNVLPRIVYYIQNLLRNHKEECLNIIIACKQSICNINNDFKDILIEYLDLIILLNFL